MKRVLTLLLLIVTVAGCTTIKNIFNNVKSENIQPPKPLVEFTPTVNVQKLWGERIGKGAQKSGAHLAPAYADGKLYAASTNGEIEVLDAKSGKRIWSKKSDLAYAGGPTVAGDLVVVGTLDGQVQALNAADGAERWKIDVSSEVLSAPALQDGLVVVRTYDGHVYGLDAADGSRRWIYDRASVPLLSLRGNAAPLLDAGVVYDGEDNGKVLALRAGDGNLLWEQTLATGEGRSEIERLQDVDGRLVVEAGIVYAAGYRGQIAALIAQSGRPLWTRDLSSYTGVALSASQIYVADGDSNVWALDRHSGASEWKQDGLQYRWVGEPAVQGDYVVIGDLEGFVHWLAISDGKFSARMRLSKNPIRVAPVIVDDIAYVEDVAGEIGAYRIGK